jgi:nitrite reductase/ring-hydroxylating ferredoxin subunit
MVARAGSGGQRRALVHDAGDNDRGVRVMAATGEWVKVASASAIGSGEMLGVETGGKSIAIFHLDDGTWCATDNVCTHAFALLTDGWMEDGVIECPLHAGRFECRTGKGLGDPIEEDLKTFEVRIDGDDVLVKVA